MLHIKKMLLSALFIASTPSFCAESSLPKFVTQELVESFAAGTISELVRPKIRKYFKNQPERRIALLGIIILANGLNIFRDDQNRMIRLIVTLLGTSATMFIRNGDNENEE